jgi:energy-coupling factor transport system substrate-specific component
MIDVSWLRLCTEGQTENCVEAVHLAYLGALVAGGLLLAVIARRSRELSTATLTLMTVAIAINVAVGATVVLLRLPVYLDSIGTILVGVLAGPWAGALTGLLANLIWAILPVPGGAGPTVAFFAPVAAVIGLMAGFWAGRGAFRLRSDDERVGGFLALAAGVGVAVVALVVVQQTVGLGFDWDDPASQTRFVLLGLLITASGVAAAWVSGRTIFRLGPGDTRIAGYLSAASAVSAAAIVFAVLRLLFAPQGYFSGIDGVLDDGRPDEFLGGANLTVLAVPDPAGLAGAAVAAFIVGALVWRWISRGERARLFPVWVGGLTTGLVAATISAPIAAGVFGGVTGGGTDALVALFRTMGLNVFQSAFAQGLTSDPLDKTISYTVVFFILGSLPLTVRIMFGRGETNLQT